MKQKCRRKQDQRGTTLAETLIAVAISTTVVFGLAALVASAVRQAKDAGGSVTVATALAAEKIDRVLALTFNTTTTAAGLTCGTPNPSSPATCGGDLTSDVTDFYEYLDINGVVQSGVTSPNAATIYMRRWQIVDISSTLKRVTVQVWARPTTRALSNSSPGSVLVSLKAQI